MRLFGRSQICGLLYLAPIQLENEYLPTDKIRILCCDAKGKVGSKVIDTSVYELARAHLQELDRAHKSCAIIAMETVSDVFVPVAIELSIEQIYALNHIYDHAIKRGYIPDILKRYSRDIIQRGEDKYRLLERSSGHMASEVLKWLPDYPDGELEVAIPMYKSQCRYPVIILKRLSSSKESESNMQRLIILDNDGDLATIRVPLDIIDRAERNFKEWRRMADSEGCLICLPHSGSLMISRIEITRLQKRALDEIIRYYEETGHGKQPISNEAQTVLVEARVHSMENKT